MTLSQNEVNAMCYKAARGFGLSWGLAEEAGKAVRWLVGVGLPGPKALADLLDELGDPKARDNAPEPKGNHWGAQGQGLCPITTGAALCDGAIPLRSGQPLALIRVVEPLLLLPFAALVAGRIGQPVGLTFGGLRFTITRHGTSQSGSGSVSGQRDCTLSLVTSQAQTDMPHRTRADISQDVLDRLNAYAQRTYAPATQASRLLGAG